MRCHTETKPNAVLPLCPIFIESFQNDIKKGECALSKFVCIVFDEAHRASGNYAYCGVAAALSKAQPHCRILALSATPGSDLAKVQNVCHGEWSDFRDIGRAFLGYYCPHSSFAAAAYAITLLCPYITITGD